MVENFWAVRDDLDFKNQLYQRGIINSELQQATDKYPYEDQENPLRLRHAISPVAKNVSNIRHKTKPVFDYNEVQKVEKVLKDLIDRGFGFSD